MLEDLLEEENDLREKVKRLEGKQQHCAQEVNGDNYPYTISSSQKLHACTSQRDWKSNFGCSCHLAKDASHFSSLSMAKEDNIFIIDDYALPIMHFL